MAEAKQVQLMKIVLFCLIKPMVDEFYKAKGDAMDTDNVAKRVKEFLKKISGGTACTLFCRAAFECNIALHSGYTLFEKVTEDDEFVSFLTSKLLNESSLTPEEQCHVDVIQKAMQKLPE